MRWLEEWRTDKIYFVSTVHYIQSREAITLKIDSATAMNICGTVDILDWILLCFGELFCALLMLSSISGLYLVEALRCDIQKLSGYCQIASEGREDKKMTLVGNGCSKSLSQILVLWKTGDRDTKVQKLQPIRL